MNKFSKLSVIVSLLGVFFIAFCSLSLNVNALEKTPIYSMEGTDGMAFDPVGNSIVISKEVKIENYDFSSWELVYITGSGVEIKNCSNITKIIIASGADTSIMGNDISNGDYGILVSSGVNNVSICNNHISGTEYAVKVGDCSNIVVSENVIDNNIGYDAIRIEDADHCQVSKNKITNSARYAIEIQNDDSSVISYNLFSGNCLKENVGSDAVLIYNSKGTEFVGNTITDTKSQDTDWGNGLIVGKSDGILVSENMVTDSGNHGIQVSWEAKNVTLFRNSISKSHNDGVSVSRGSQNISIEKNDIFDNAGYGIVVDAQSGYEGYTDGTISVDIIDNSISGSTEGAIFCKGVSTAVPTVNIESGTCKNNYVGLSVNGTSKVYVEDTVIEDCSDYGIGWRGTATGTIKKVSVDGFHNYGLLIEENGNVNVSDSVFSMPSRSASSGITLYAGASAVINNCKIYNCEGYNNAPGSVVAVNGSNISAKNNQVIYSGNTLSNYNSYYIEMTTGDVVTERIYGLSIAEEETSISTFHEGSEAGVVLGNKKIESVTGGDGKALIKYSSQASTSGIVAYVADKYGNYSIYNAPVGFDINNLGVSPEQHNQIVAFITRLYEVCLDRTPDESGINYWVNRLEKGEITGISTAYDFVFSEEFKSHNYCKECYVSHLYNAFMGREADEGGFEYWKSLLNTGVIREEVFNRFANSEEFSGICESYGIELGKSVTLPERGSVPAGMCDGCGKVDDITQFVLRLYNITLDRSPDESGLAYWHEQLSSGAISGKKAAEGFLFSEEYVDKNHPDDIYIEYLYNAMMGRSSDEAGKAYWMELSKNGLSRSDMFDLFADSPEFKEICQSYGIVCK